MAEVALRLAALGVWMALYACAASRPAGVADPLDGGTSSAEADGAVDAEAASCPPDPPASVAGDRHAGDLVIASAADAAAAQGIAEVGGDLRVIAAYAGPLVLPNLRVVEGSIRVEGVVVADVPAVIWPGITELRLPNLTRVGDELFLYLTDALVETDLRRLEHVGTRVYIHRNLALRRMGLDSLREGTVLATGNPLLAACEVEAVCAQTGARACGDNSGPGDCSCEPRCGRLEPSC